MKTMKYTGFDDAKWGVSDFYEDFEKALAKQLKSRCKEWTTGWRGVKKEIQSFKITAGDGVLALEASVSDDLDTDGVGLVVLKKPWSMQRIKDGLDEACDRAEANRKENEVYIGFSIHNNKGYWVETYIMDAGFGFRSPPGDNYHRWGWQSECQTKPRLTSVTKRKMERWMQSLPARGAKKKFGDWEVKRWD